MRAIHFARFCVVPPARTARKPANGMMRRRERMYVISRTSEGARQEPQEQREEQNRDDADDDDPGVALYLSRLFRPQEHAGPPSPSAGPPSILSDNLPVESVRV